MSETLYFGQFLLSNKIVTREQLVQAVEHQRKSHLRLGDYAMRGRLMSRREVSEVIAHQKRHRTLFGEAAVALGHLTQAQVDRLLRRQRNDRVLLGEALVELGYVSVEVLQIELARFERASFHASGDTSACIPQSVPMADVADSLFVLSQNMLMNSWGLEVKMGYAQLAVGQLRLKDINATVTFCGDIETCYFVGVPRPLAVAGAAKFVGVSDAPFELLVDVVREYANLVAGAFVARSAVRGQQCGFASPRECTEQIACIGNREALWIPLVVGNQYVVVATTIRESEPEKGTTGSNGFCGGRSPASNRAPMGAVRGALKSPGARPSASGR